jgi:IS5 family transposase
MANPKDERQKDLFRPSLDQIIDMNHPLVLLAGKIDWAFIDGAFGSVCGEGPGQPPLPTRETPLSQPPKGVGFTDPLSGTLNI